VDFDGRAATWDADDERARRTAAVAEQMRARLGGRTYRRGLDFGAGTGSLSLLLADRFDEIVLVDTSSGMLAVAAGKVEAAGRALPARITPLVTDLTAAGGAAGIEPVDVVYSLMALHHVGDVETLLRAFHGLLVPGGLALFADLDADEDGSYHAHVEGFDGHHGLDRSALARWLGAAGFAVLSQETVVVVHRHGEDGGGRDYPVVLTVAQRRA
jgi:2-polyprenyl-3-methyl-5-hydroxy-6-metoxy-1,4-benzoquinol methylase